MRQHHPRAAIAAASFVLSILLGAGPAHAQYTGSKVPFGEGCTRTYAQGVIFSGGSAEAVLEMFRAAANGLGCIGNEYTGFHVVSNVPTASTWSGTVHCSRGAYCSFPVGGTKPAQRYDISLAGASHTHALPAGPALPHAAVVTLAGAAVAGKAVSIGVASGGVVSGVTDAAGRFEFVYVPPASAGTDVLTANCADCLKPATKPIEVSACDPCSR